MTLPVLIERIGNNGYRAKTGEPLVLTAEGASREEALGNLRQALQGRLQNGSEILSLVVDAGEKETPWLKYAGMFKDDADFADVQRIMAENRQRMDADPDVP